MFKPRYTISSDLLNKLKQIAVLANDFERRSHSRVVLLDFEERARGLSAFASTSIEGNPLPLTEVKKLIKSHPKNIRETEREVLNYNKALQLLHDRHVNDDLVLNNKIILKLHGIVMDGLLPRFNCGKWRNAPVFVNNPKTRKPIFFPPDHGDVLKLMENLLSFVSQNSSSLDAVILSGLFHKQMILIHPFVDGNGRTTRLATKVLLSGLGINTFPLFSFENFYNKNVSTYFKNVDETGDFYEVSKGLDFSNWLNYFADGILDEMLRVQKEVSQFSISPETVVGPLLQLLLGHIKKVGYTNDREYSKITERAKATRALDFRKLQDLGLIARMGLGKNTIYKLKD